MQSTNDMLAASFKPSSIYLTRVACNPRLNVNRRIGRPAPPEVPPALAVTAVIVTRKVRAYTFVVLISDQESRVWVRDFIFEAGDLEETCQHDAIY